MFDIKKDFFVWFRLVQSSAAIVKKAEEIGNLSILTNIRITESSGGTLTHILTHVRLQVIFDKKGKPWKFCKFYLKLVYKQK